LVNRECDRTSPPLVLFVYAALIAAFASTIVVVNNLFEYRVGTLPYAGACWYEAYTRNDENDDDFQRRHNRLPGGHPLLSKAIAYIIGFYRFAPNAL
jgi:hypothetical protein